MGEFAIVTTLSALYSYIYHTFSPCLYPLHHPSHFCKANNQLIITHSIYAYSIIYIHTSQCNTCVPLISTLWCPYTWSRTVFLCFYFHKMVFQGFKFHGIQETTEFKYLEKQQMVSNASHINMDLISRHPFFGFTIH